LNQQQYRIACENLERRRKRIGETRYDQEFQHLTTMHYRWRDQASGGASATIRMLDANHPRNWNRDSMWNLPHEMIQQMNDVYTLTPIPKDEEEMKPLPDTATADSVIAAKADADAKRKRDQLIRELASVVEAADLQRNTARETLKKAKEGRRALKDVRDNPKATDAEIRDAIKEAQKCGIYGRP
jgi:hypothetical protein